MEGNLSEVVYKGIVEDIVTGRINTDTVITERELMIKYKVSKSPIRDALIKLSSDNILYSIPRYGYKVNVVDREYLEGIQRFRWIIEPYYLEYYFDNFTDDTINYIRKKLPVFKKDVFQNPAVYWQLTSEFHLLLAEVYRDQYYYDTLKRILDNQLITFSQLYWYNWGQVIDKKIEDNHSIILDYIEIGNIDEAVKTLQKDIMSF